MSAKKRIVFSSVEEQAKLTQLAFLALSPIERLIQLRKDIERVYCEELKNKKPRSKRIIFDEYIPR